MIHKTYEIKQIVCLKSLQGIKKETEIGLNGNDNVKNSPLQRMKKGGLEGPPAKVTAQWKPS